MHCRVCVNFKQAELAVCGVCRQCSVCVCVCVAFTLILRTQHVGTTGLEVDILAKDVAKIMVFLSRFERNWTPCLPADFTEMRQTTAREKCCKFTKNTEIRPTIDLRSDA